VPIHAWSQINQGWQTQPSRSKVIRTRITEVANSGCGVLLIGLAHISALELTRRARITHPATTSYLETPSGQATPTIHQEASLIQPQLRAPLADLSCCVLGPTVLQHSAIVPSGRVMRRLCITCHTIGCVVPRIQSLKRFRDVLFASNMLLPLEMLLDNTSVVALRKNQKAQTFYRED
jgi:hypothetical protein